MFLSLYIQHPPTVAPDPQQQASSTRPKSERMAQDITLTSNPAVLLRRGSSQSERPSNPVRYKQPKCAQLQIIPPTSSKIPDRTQHPIIILANSPPDRLNRKITMQTWAICVHVHRQYPAQAHGLVVLDGSITICGSRRLGSRGMEPDVPDSCCVPLPVGAVCAAKSSI